MDDEQFLAMVGAKRRRRRLIVLLLLVLLLIVLPAGFWLGVHFYWKGKLRDALDAARATGDPVTWDEVLDARQVPPDDQNSALVFLQAFDVLALQAEASGIVEEKLALDWQWSRGTAPSEEAQSIVGGYVERRDEALQLIEEAAQLPSGAYPLDTSSPPYAMLMDHLAQMRGAARLCGTAAVYHAANGNGEAAVEALSCGRRLAASLGHSVTLIEALVRAASDALWLSGMQRTLELTELPADDLAALRRLVAQEEEDFEPRWAFLGERAMGLTVFGDEAQLGMTGQATRLAKLRHLVPGWAERDEAFYLSYLGRTIGALKLDGVERLRALEQVEADVTAQLEEHRFRYLLSGLILPALSRAVHEFAKGEARFRCAQAALAVEEWRIRNGHWPDSLAQLVPDLLDAVPVDPFTDAPLRYVVGEDTVAVYSVGVDGVDDGGLTSEEAQATAGGPYARPGTSDEVFRLLKPELRGASRRAFRQEVNDHGFSPDDLQQAGYTTGRLRALGFTDEDLQSLGFRP